MSTKVNEKPYELFGFHHDDFLRWCKLNGKKHYLRESKTEFFKLVKENHIVNKNGVCMCDGKEF